MLAQCLLLQTHLCNPIRPQEPLGTDGLLHEWVCGVVPCYRNNQLPQTTLLRELVSIMSGFHQRLKGRLSLDVILGRCLSL